jgi:hypothetical protein
MNSYEQFYIQLYLHNNKLVSEQYTGEHNPLHQLNCDFQRRRDYTWPEFTCRLRNKDYPYYCAHCSYRNVWLLNTQVRGILNIATIALPKMFKAYWLHNCYVNFTVFIHIFILTNLVFLIFSVKSKTSTP